MCNSLITRDQRLRADAHPFSNVALIKVLADPSPGSPLIPELLYSFFQMEFAAVTAAILVVCSLRSMSVNPLQPEQGGIAERGRMLPTAVFTFVWVTLVYCPLANWAWGINGWGFKWYLLFTL